MAEDKKLTKRVIRKAADIWSLSMIIHTDGVAETDNENAIRDEARIIAMEKLSKMGIEPCEVARESDAICLAKKMIVRR